MHGYENIRRFDIAMNDSFLMGVMHPFADISKQPEPLLNIESILITVSSDGHALDVFHYEVRPASLCCSGVKYMGNIRMIQQGQGLAFGLEAGDYLRRIHAGLDDFQGHPAFDRLFLLGQINQSHAAFSDKR